jgi:hypothetical protein
VYLVQSFVQSRKSRYFINVCNGYYHDKTVQIKSKNCDKFITPTDRVIG